MLDAHPHTKHVLHVIFFITGIALGALSMWFYNAHAQCASGDIICMSTP